MEKSRLHNTKIRIGGSFYTVLVQNEVSGRDSEGRVVDLYGKFDYGDKTIELESSMHPEAAVTVLLHEIIHGLFSNAGVRDEAERDVEIISHGLVQLLRDNPGLYGYIIDPTGKSLVDNIVQPKSPSVPTQRRAGKRKAS